MNKRIVYANKMCYAREMDRLKRMHRSRIANMPPTSATNARATLDMNEPPSYPHLENKAKKRQMEEERYAKIEHENRMLMERMYLIMNQKPDPRAVEYSPGMRINRKTGMPMVDNYLSTRSLFAGNAVPKPSMNQDARRMEYKRIMKENEEILRRITEGKPTYRRKEWSEDRKRQEVYLKSIAHDTTSGFLPQRADGKSVYYRDAPSSRGRVRSSKSLLPPLEAERPEWQSGGDAIWSPQIPPSPIDVSKDRRARTAPGRKRRSAAKKASRGGSRTGSRSGTRKGKRRARGGAGGAGGGADDLEAPAILAQLSRTLRVPQPDVVDRETGKSTPAAEREERCVLIISEVPLFAGSSNEAPKPGTSGVEVHASLASGVAAQLHLTIDQLKEIAKGSHDPTVGDALKRLTLLDARGHFSRMSLACSPPELAAIGRAVSRRVSVVVDGDGSIHLQVNAKDEDHGEGGENDWEEDLDGAHNAAVRVQSMHRMRVARKKVDERRRYMEEHEWAKKGMGRADRAAVKVQSAARARAARKHVERIRSQKRPWLDDDEKETSKAATKLQAAERGRKARRRVKLMAQEKELGKVLHSKGLKVPAVKKGAPAVFCSVRVFDSKICATVVDAGKELSIDVTAEDKAAAEDVLREKRAIADITGKRTDITLGSALLSLLRISHGDGKYKLVLDHSVAAKGFAT